MGQITGSPIGTISGVIKAVTPSITGNITYGMGEGEYIPEYEDSYTITPQAFQDIVLPTKNKQLKDNIIIKEIPYYETSNTSGGNTVYIAGQIEFY